MVEYASTDIVLDCCAGVLSANVKTLNTSYSYLFYERYIYSCSCKDCPKCGMTQNERSYFETQIDLNKIDLSVTYPTTLITCWTVMRWLFTEAACVNKQFRIHNRNNLLSPSLQRPGTQLLFAHAPQTDVGEYPTRHHEAAYQEHPGGKQYHCQYGGLEQNTQLIDYL